MSLGICTCVSNQGMHSRKRQRILAPVRGPGSGSTLNSGSRFVPCPACGASVPVHSINSHLDEGCPSLPAPAVNPPAATAAVPHAAVIGQLVDAPSQSTTSADADLPEHRIPAPAQQQIVQMLAPARAPLAWARMERRQLPLTAQQLAQNTPCELVRDALPPALAKAVLQARLCCQEPLCRCTVLRSAGEDNGLAVL